MWLVIDMAECVHCKNTDENIPLLAIDGLNKLHACITIFQELLW